MEPREWTGQTIIGSRVRDLTCMDQSQVLAVIQKGDSVNIIGEGHGWWQVELRDGTIGYVGHTLIQVTNTSSYAYVASEKSSDVSTSVTVEATENTEVAPVTASQSFLERIRGRILLQVENNGEAWYVDPASDKRYYMKDGPTAYEMMRAFGLGISESNYTKLANGDQGLLTQLAGKIVLRVEKLGEAYYIHPEKRTIHYLRDGDAAYTIMRELSLGITNKDLEKVESREFKPITGTDNTVSPVVINSAQPNITVSARQQGSLPSNIDIASINNYWLNKVNSLRAERGLSQLVLDQRWVDTASDYAAYMGTTGATNHERADGSSMHQWIDTQGLTFTSRYSDGGWRSNYFTENISWGYTNNSNSGLESVLDDTLSFYLSEASYNGPHYRTIYHEDWNSVGAGFYFVDQGNGKYKVYCVFHYGSLVM